MTAASVLQRELDRLKCNNMHIGSVDPTVFVPLDKSYIPYTHRMEIVAQYLEDRLKELRKNELYL